MHSYHYHWPTRLKDWQKELRGIDVNTEVKPKEVYARDVGQELEKKNLPNVVIKESPKVRNVDQLLKKYESKCVLDLHDPARNYNPKCDELSRIALVMYGKNKTLDGYLGRFVQKNYPEKKMGKEGYLNVNEVDFHDSLYRPRHGRWLAVELWPWAGKEKSLKFLERFTSSLKSEYV